MNRFISNRHRPNRRAILGRSGFTLVELAIVLVILGLLVGGVLTGQTLINAAELRTIARDAEMYRTAVYSFKDRYNGLPGDIKNATAFWGAKGTCPPAEEASPQSPATKETCDGDGNGKIGPYPVIAGVGGGRNEWFYFWQHLANAGLISGTFTGVPGGSSRTYHFEDENCPRSRYRNNACWGVFALSASGDTGIDGRFGDYPAGKNGNTLMIGSRKRLLTNPFITPENMWNVDTKMDDGLPDQGSVVIGLHHTDCHLTVGGQLQYNVNYKGDACMMLFRFDF